MLSAEENQTLTRVGPGTPMGRLLRHYWFPVAGTGELPPGATRRVRLLGEDLVVFRTTAGVLGLVDEACPHRGASLARGEVDATGLRCPYHGWKFGTDGACLEMPAEGDASLRRRVPTARHHARELGGLVFAHIGTPAGGQPPRLPRYELLVRDDLLRDIGRARLPCNWLQIMENSVDPTHVEWLHGRHLASVRAARGQSTPGHYRRRHERIGFELFEHGILKRRVIEGGSEQDDDWAVGHPLVFPVMLQVGAGPQRRFQIRVPEDDTTTRHWWYSTYAAPEGAPTPRQAPADVPVYEVPWRDEQGGFIVDFVDGGDIMTWVTQGPVADRTREHLVPSDKGIALLRRLLFDQLARVQRGQDPLGVVRDPARADEVITLPQERDKYRDGAGFLAESVALSHVRHSPLRAEIEALLQARPRPPIAAAEGVDETRT